jgi:hypothetical protein
MNHYLTRDRVAVATALLLPLAVAAAALPLRSTWSNTNVALVLVVAVVAVAAIGNRLAGALAALSAAADAGSSTAPCSAIRPAWRRTAP